MHVLIINGSPRIKKYSNTDKIIESFAKGFTENGNTYEQYEISDRTQWEAIEKSFSENRKVLIALPLYVENIPGLLLEFLETLTPKNDGTEISFLLQGGFSEGCQLRCGEAYLKILSEKLGCVYAGTLVKGDNFGIRFFEEKERERITAPYREMGREFGRTGSFDSEECRAFTGPERFSAPVRLILGLVMKTFAKKAFVKSAESLGCSRPLDYRPYL